jgi:hypothetical protein
MHSGPNRAKSTWAADFPGARYNLPTVVSVEYHIYNFLNNYTNTRSKQCKEKIMTEIRNDNYHATHCYQQKQQNYNTVTMYIVQAEHCQHSSLAGLRHTHQNLEKSEQLFLAA